MLSNWPKSLALVLKSEGGNDDDPEDHGGRTSRGITQKEYDRWCRNKGLPLGDVWAAPQEHIDAIYKEEYWDPHGDALPVGLDYLYFDMAVNAGPYRATVLLQRALGVAADGKIGPITMQAIQNADPKALIQKYSEAKKAFYVGLNQPRFTRGWLNRTNEVQIAASGMLAAGDTMLAAADTGGASG